MASDGAWTPEQVVRGALAGGLDILALADHDTTSGVEKAVRAASGTRLRVIPATELSSTFGNHEIHILGYFVDPSAPALERHHRRAVQLRRDRLAAMVGRLRDDGVEIEMDAVMEAAGEGHEMLARPHLARAMVAAGLVTSVPEAFDLHLGNHCPAFVPTALQSPLEAVDVVLRSGGIPVWAHPPFDLLDSLLSDLVSAGLRGLEVFRPSTSRRGEERLRAVARAASLVMSGGSDWHDPERSDPLGAFYVTGRDIQALLDLRGL